MNKRALIATLLLKKQFEILHKHNVYIEPLIADYAEHNNKAKLCSEIKKQFDDAGVEAMVNYLPDGLFYIAYRTPNTLSITHLTMKLNFEKG